jgi:hypothetical protein
LLATTLAAVLGLGALTLSAPAAGAAQLESFRWSFSDSVVSGVGSECGFDFDVQEDFTIGGKYSISKGTPQTGGQYFRVKSLASYAGTYTNLETGAFFTQEWHTNFRELPATIVDETGPVVTYQTKESGVWDVLRDSSGRVRYRSAGNLVFQWVYDTEGDSAPGGLVLDEQFIRTSGHWTTFDADICAIVDELIG